MLFLGLVHTKPEYKDSDVVDLLLRSKDRDVIILPLRPGFFHVENIPDRLLAPLKEMATCHVGQKVCGHCNGPVPNGDGLKGLAKKHFPKLNS